MSGKIIARHANDGELTNGQVLLSVANYSRAIAQLAIFPKQRTHIAADMEVTLRLEELQQQSSISHITPFTISTKRLSVFPSFTWRG